MRQFSKRTPQNSYILYRQEQIGQGRYGKVYSAESKKGESVACKVIRKSEIEKLQIYSKQEASIRREQLLNEIVFHKKVSGNPNITPREYLTFMELCDTDLAKLLSNTLEQSQAITFFNHMLEGYQSLYELGFAHRDLKPQNLLIKNNVLKICDFGFVHRGLSTETQVGSIRYMAPQLLQPSSLGYDPQKSDVWSMGVILYKMLFKHEPYIAKTMEEMKELLENAPLQFPPNKVSKHVLRLLTKMLVKDPFQRLSFPEVHRNYKATPALLQVYNTAIVDLWRDANKYATLREIHITPYAQKTYQLMNLLHAKRKKIGINAETLAYDHHIYQSPADSNTLYQALIRVYYGLQYYTDYPYSLKSIQIMLMTLLILLIFEAGAFSAMEVVKLTLKINNMDNNQRLDYMEVLRSYVAKVHQKDKEKDNFMKKSRNRNKSSCLKSSKENKKTYQSLEKRK